MLSYRWLFSASCQPVEAIASFAAAATQCGVIFQGSQSRHLHCAREAWLPVGCICSAVYTTRLETLRLADYGSNRILSDFSPFFIIWYCLFDLVLIGLRWKPMSLSCFNLIAICRLSGSTKKNQIKVVTENDQTPFTQLDNLDIKFRFTQLQNRPKYEYKDIGKGYHFSFPKLLSNVTVLYCLDSYLLVFSLFNI